ncbi:GNAT family N-acetyltransferase [Streptomyces zagrosensis]|uniref:RimJ/RimL family protein N-acetyltransferase n=1 Tax=Streptomyces zagrosensis TaxID=1042984 RepID=A0A7W9QFW2_9ACTN|nr:GNAT family protein [Streptomyces zagrosensis]MBB5939530.1 RimJ/RimL family protein N-acetyltransferase [Streptomyces zagrosensis]
MHEETATREPTVMLDRLRPGDWVAVHAWRRLDQVCRFQPWGPETQEQTQAFVREAARAWSRDPQYRFPYLARRGDDVVGMGELHVRDEEQRQGEVVCFVHPNAWGGTGTAIAHELLRRGFEQLGLHRIYATCDPRNRRSARVLTKVGMTYERRHRHTVLIRDGWRDSDIFSILEHEWRRQPA